MNASEYGRLYDSLNSLDDVRELSKRGLDKDLLTVILTQKIVRETKRRFYHVKTMAPDMVRQWASGASISSIARKINFPPALTVQMMLQQMNFTKGDIKDYVRDPMLIKDERLRSELLRAVSEDLVYSPQGTAAMWNRGKDVEMRVKQWLTASKVRFITEYDAKKGQAIKTPDFRFELPVKIFGKWINWVECKASFGDETEVRRDYFKQLVHYVDLFGQGIVVYWYGYLEGNLKDTHIIITDRSLVEGVSLG